jgi:hypothetical protein
MSVQRGCFSGRLTRARITHARFLFIAAALPLPGVLAAQMVTVGRNVHVSVAQPNDSHSEVILAADPKNAGRLLAGVHIAYGDTIGTKSIAYASFDSGKTWSVSLERRDSTITADAAVAYGPDGSAYFATLARWGLYRSRDGGRTWDPPSKAPPAYAWDREYLVADFTGGKYHGRVYMNATVFPLPAYVADTTTPAPGGGGGRETATGLYTSTDGGSTFGNPITRLVSRPEGILGMANIVVLSDGTVMFLYGHRKPNAAGGGGRGGIAAFTPLPAANYWLEVITSTDGGETLNNAYRIGDYWMNRPRSEGAVIPHLAVDPGSALFKDRLYVVWSDFRSNRLEILFSYSSDKGRTWSTPVTINDDRPAADALKNGPDNITPTVAVNKDGVVAVTWHDRRDFADNLGWNVRFRASLDGGETWTPSVKVNDKPTAFGGTETWVAASGGGGGAAAGGRAADSLRSGGRVISLNARLSNANFTFAPGHNGAFAADAAGGFHPMWIDNRTGMYQVWTATVTVAGHVALNGGGDLADLKDLSARANLEVVKSTYDRQTNRLTLRTRLRNTSKTDTLVGPLKARALNVTSQVANVEVVNADNRMRGPGAVWDFTSMLTNGQLLPEALSAPKDLVFQLSDLRSFQEGIELRLGLVSMNAKILGPAPARRPRMADRSGQ